MRLSLVIKCVLFTKVSPHLSEALGTLVGGFYTDVVGAWLVDVIMSNDNPIRRLKFLEYFRQMQTVYDTPRLSAQRLLRHVFVVRQKCCIPVDVTSFPER